MSHCRMIREPEVLRRDKGFPRWAVEWALFDPESLRSFTRRRKFLTRRRAERWIESKRIKPENEWRTP